MTYPLARRRNYNVVRPLGTHVRVASCEEVDCPDYLRGWRTRVPAGDEQMVATIKRSGRKYVETTALGDGGVREFVFEPGQPCFRTSTHRVSLNRPAIHLIRNGTADARRVSAQGWHDDLGEHLDRIREAQERG